MTAINLRDALNSAQYVSGTVQSDKSAKKYLNEKFQVVVKEKHAASVRLLVNQTWHLYKASHDPDKLNQAKAILDALEVQIDPTYRLTLYPQKTHRFIQIMKEEMEKERLGELPNFLSHLCHIKEYLQIEGESLQKEYSIVQARKHLNEVWIYSEQFLDGKEYATVKSKDPNFNKTLFNMFNSTEGLALLARFPQLIKVDFSKQEIVGIQFNLISEEEIKVLQDFIHCSSDSTNHIARVLCKTWEIDQVFKKNNLAGMVENLVKARKKADFEGNVDGVFEPFSKLIFHLNHPKRGMQGLDDFFLRRHKINQIIRREINALHDIYANACKEYSDLQGIYFSELEPFQFPLKTLPSLHDDLISKLPSPEEFVSMVLPELPPFDKREFLEVYNNKEDSEIKLEKKEGVAIAQEAPHQISKRKHKKYAILSSKGSPVDPGNLDVADKCGRGKSDSDGKSNNALTYDALSVSAGAETVNSFRSSPPHSEAPEKFTFTRHNFPYETIQLADRVSEWRENPDLALSRPEYAWIAGRPNPDKLRYEITWKHDVRNVLLALGTEYSREYPWKDGKCYILQAEIIDQYGTVHRGFFRATFNVKGELYHFDFGSKTNIQMADAIINNKMFNKEDFPTLEDAHRDFLAKEQSESYICENVPITINQIGIVELHEETYDLTIRLFHQGRI